MVLAGRVLTVDNWFAKNAFALSRIMEVLFGAAWAADASFKYQAAFVQGFSGAVSGAASGQPAWMAGWFAFWSGMTSANPALFAYTVAILESLLAVSLIFGIARKIGYGGGFFLSLVIWSVPEGFGGPYGPSSTDIGTGIIYAFVFIFLAILNGLYGPSRYTIDYLIEERFPHWKSVAEIRRR